MFSEAKSPRNRLDISPTSYTMYIINRFIDSNSFSRIKVAYAPQSSIKTYSVHLGMNPWNVGTISGGGYYEDGTQITVSALPNDGYRFVNWTRTSLEGSVEVSTKAQYSFTVTESVNLVAHFTEEGVTVWDKKSTFDNLKTWTIGFNKALDPSTITSTNIYVDDQQGSLFPTKLELSSDKKSVKIVPLSVYMQAPTYYLNILKKIQSKDGENLKESIKMPFEHFTLN